MSGRPFSTGGRGLQRRLDKSPLRCRVYPDPDRIPPVIRSDTRPTRGRPTRGPTDTRHGDGDTGTRHVDRARHGDGLRKFWRHGDGLRKFGPTRGRSSEVRKFVPDTGDTGTRHLAGRFNAVIRHMACVKFQQTCTFNLQSFELRFSFPLFLLTFFPYPKCAPQK